MTPMDETVILVYILSGNLLAEIILHRISSIIRYTMPATCKGTFLGRQIPRAATMRNRKSKRKEDQIQQDNTDVRERMAQLHRAESEDSRAERNEQKLEQRKVRRFIVSRR